MRDQINDQIQTATKNFTETNDRVLDTIVDTNRKVVEFAVKVADQFPEVPEDLPLADRLPTPEKAGDTYLDFVERAVTLNRDYSARVVDMINRVDTPAPKAAAKKVPVKTTAKKTTPKKTTRKPAAKKAAASK